MLYNYQTVMNDKELRILAGNLRKARKTANLTQEGLARKADITSSYYARLERGEYLPSLNTLRKIIKATGSKSSQILPF